MRSDPTALQRPAAVLVTVLAGLAAAVAVGVSPLLTAVGIVALAALLLLVTRPQWLTVAVVGVIYSNAIVVAMAHGLPAPLAAMPFLALIIPFAYLVLARGKPIVWTTATTWMTVFGLVFFASALLSGTREDTLTELLTFALEGAGLFFLITNTVRSASVFRACIMALVLTAAFMGAIAVFQYATGRFWTVFGGFGTVSAPYALGEAAAPTVESWEVQQDYRVSGPIGEPNYFAMILLAVLPWAAFLVATAERRVLRAGWLACGLLIAAGVVLTYSRGALVAAVLVLGGLAVVGVLPRRTLLGLAGAGLAALALVPALAGRLATLGSALGLGRATVVDEGDAAARGRYSELLAALRAYADHPVVGVGPGQFPSHYQRYAGEAAGGVHVGGGPRYAHNLLLGLAADLGTLGLVAFIGLAVTIFIGLWRLRRDPVFGLYATAALASLLLLAVASMFLHLAYMRYMWLHLALAVALICIARVDAARRQHAERQREEVPA